MRPPRVVLDTNIFVAASRSREGAFWAVLQALRRGRFVALASVPLMIEYEAVLLRPEQLLASGRQADEVERFLNALSKLLEPVHLHFLWRPQLRDPADEMVLETALNGRVEALVTLNGDDFAAAERFRLRVLTPGEFLHRLQSEENE